MRPPRRRHALFQPLEARRLFCGLPHGTSLMAYADDSELPDAPTPIGAAIVQTLPNGMPILHSSATAPTAIFLDFDGDGTRTPYDVDGNAAVFNATEQSQITESWRQVSAYFAMFDVNVTTIPPAQPKAWISIANNHSGVGYSYVNVFPNTRPQSFNPSGDARSRNSGIVHELGHNFGLSHQSTYDQWGAKTAEYASAADPLDGLLMGVDFSGTVHKWSIGHPSGSVSNLQNDINVIANKIKTYQAAGGDGFRSDDFPGGFDQAHALTESSAEFTAGGVIERMTDADVFSFNWTGGRATIAATPDNPSGVDLKMELYDSAGTLIAAADASATNNQTFTLSLDAGLYYVSLASHGDYGDLGMYDLAIKPSSSTVTPPTYNTLPSPQNLNVIAGTGSGFDLSWDAVEGATGYRIERSSDGVTWAQAGTTTAATTYTDPNLFGSMRYFYRVSAREGSTNSAPSAVVSAINKPGAPSSVSITMHSLSALVVNWKDVSGDTGYRVERSPDGTTWTTLATVGTNVPSYHDTGLTTGTTYHYRITPLSPIGDGVSKSAVGGTRLPAVTGLAFNTIAANAISIKWNDITGETGYRIERSTTGTSWSTLANIAAGTLTYTDSTVTPVKEYYYRVMGTAGQSLGMFPTMLQAATPDDDALPAPWSSSDIGSGAFRGASSFANGTFTMVAGGNDINSSADQFHFTWQQITGNAQIIAKVNAIENTDDYAKAGVMIRESLAAGARNVAAVIQRNKGVAMQSRSSNNGTTTITAGSTSARAPYWVRLSRIGNTFTAYSSTDGVTWTTVASRDVTMGAAVYVGLALTSHDTAMMNTATFSSVQISPPRVLGSSFDNMSKLSVQFDKDVSTSLDASDLSIRNLLNDSTLTASAVSWNAATNTATWTLPDLPDGDYRATLAAAGVTDAFSFALAGPRTHDLFILTGDIDRDRTVSFADMLRISSNFGKTSAKFEDGDINGDGEVTFADLTIVSAKFGNALPASAAVFNTAAPIRPSIVARPVLARLRKSEVRLCRTFTSQS